MTPQRRSIAWCGECGNVSVDGINFTRVEGGLECARCGAVSEEFEYVQKATVPEDEEVVPTTYASRVPK